MAVINGNNLANNLFGVVDLPVDLFDIFNGLGGNDTVIALGTNDFLNGNDGNDRLIGGDGDDVIGGGKDNDILSGDTGNDILTGGTGTDILIGGAGTDTLVGGVGNDIFVFNSVLESQPGVLLRDVITDFVGNGPQLGDRINLSNIDADSTTPGKQDFTFIRDRLFTPGIAGEVRFSGGILQATTNGSTLPELEIGLPGVPTTGAGRLVASDLIL